MFLACAAGLRHLGVDFSAVKCREVVFLPPTMIVPGYILQHYRILSKLGEGLIAVVQ